MKNPVQNGAMIALAAATLFAAACSSRSPSTSQTTPSTMEKTASVHCMGINSCKGQGSCKTAQNACKGQNSCKRQGFVDVASDDECTTKGGTVMASM